MPVSKNQTHAKRPVALGIARQGAEGAKADHRTQEPGVIPTPDSVFPVTLPAYP
jgi:hypothetical protein